MGNAEYSRQLGRRVILAHRNKAQQGKRPGGPAPYGMRFDATGGLVLGPQNEIRVVRRIFEWYANDGLSANEIANRLNRRNISAPGGGAWSRQSVLEILDREAYTGTFTWNRRSRGQFWFTENGEVKDVSERASSKGNGTIRKKAAFGGIISRKLWDKAQQRRRLNSQTKRKPRSTIAPLARILVCDHCGKHLESFRKRGRRYYRCATAGRHGKDSCGYFSVAEGTCFGLLGPNGAGKTTLLHTLLGFHPASEGTARVLGEDIRTGSKAIRSMVGYMPENESYVPGITAVHFVRLMAELSGLPPSAAMERAHESLFYVGLGEARYRKMETFSLGMKQRVKLAQALVHAPKLVILDEPTNGLDPPARH